MNKEIVRYVKDAESPKGPILVITDVDDYVISVSRVENFFATPLVNTKHLQRNGEDILKVMFPAKIGHYLQKKELLSWGDVLELIEDEGGDALV